VNNGGVVTVVLPDPVNTSPESETSDIWRNSGARPASAATLHPHTEKAASVLRYENVAGGGVPSAATIVGHHSRSRAIQLLKSCTPQAGNDVWYATPALVSTPSNSWLR